MSRTLGCWRANDLPPQMALFFTASGVTDTEAQIVARTDRDGVALVLSTSPDLSSPTTIPGTTDADLYTRFDVDGLDPATQYHYGIEIDGVLDDKRGKFRTAPVPGTPHSYRMCHSSCSSTASNHLVFDALMAEDPDFFVHLGDKHYANIVLNIQARYRQNIEALFAGQRQAEFFRSCAMSTVWDDHDFGPNNSDSTAPGREAAAIVERQCWPHYPLPQGDTGNHSIEHAFTWGRVRYIVTDLRWHRSPNTDPDGPTKTMMGATQLAWFKAELLAAQADPDIVLIVWGNSCLWIDLAAEHDDSWSSFQYEQDDLVDFVDANGLASTMLIVSGDTHMIAADDGTNSPAGIPVLQAAPLDRSPISLGGPYSEGEFAGTGTPPYRGHYGLFEVTDDGDELTVAWTGIRINGTTAVRSEMLSLDFGPYT